MNTTPKPIKKKSLIRWEAIIPFTVVVALIAAYFHFFFDLHAKKIIEISAYKVMGVEVNINTFKTSFFKAHLLVKKIEITDSENPTHNSVEIGEIRFGMLWDALLRAKVVVNEAVVEQIAFNTKRKSRGKVKPPEVVDPNAPGALDKLKDETLARAEDHYSDNVLGNLVAMLSGSNGTVQLEKIRDQLPSKAMLEGFDKNLKSKQLEWDAKIKELPTEKDVQALNKKFNSIQHKDFKNAQQLQASLQQFDSVLKEGDALIKKVDATGKDLDADLKAVDTQYKQIEAQIKTDIKALEQHFKIPKLDAKSLSMALFGHYLEPYKQKFFRYKNMAEKYLPPKFLNKDKNNEEEIVLQPHPRENGISYEFARKNSYPLFWIKRTAISSQAGKSPQAGNVAGEILDITSNQYVIGRPTVANLSGDFPENQIMGFKARVQLDNVKSPSRIDYNAQVASFPIVGTNLVDSPEVKIAFRQASVQSQLQGHLVGFKDYALEIKNTFNKIEYDIRSSNNTAQEILTRVFSAIPTVSLDARSAGILPRMNLSINSNLGGELQKGFENEVKAQIAAAQKRIQAVIDQEIGKKRREVEAEVQKLRNQADKEVAKVKADLEKQKMAAQNQIDQAKKDAENQAKKSVEKEGKKAVDDLKKKLGW